MLYVTLDWPHSAMSLCYHLIGELRETHIVLCHVPECRYLTT